MSFYERNSWLWLIPALLLVTGLAARNLNDLLWVDEVFSIGNIGGYQGPPYNPAQVWEALSQNSPQHVPGYFFLLSGWAGLVGWTPLALRTFSLFWGLLAIVWTYRVGTDWAGSQVGLFAAFILSSSAFFIHFMHELRMYSLLAFLTIFTIWIYWRVVTRIGPVRRWEWLTLFGGALALLYSQLFGAIPLGAIGFYHLLFVRKDRRWWLVAVLLGVVGASLLPWVQVLLQGVRNIGLAETPLAVPAIFAALVHLFGNGNGVLVGVLALAGVLAWRWQGARAIWFFVLVTFVLTLIANEIRPMISTGRTRYLIHLWPLLALLCGLGLAWLARRRWLAALLLGAWLVVGLNNTLDPNFMIESDGPRYVKDYPPLRTIMAEVNPRATPDDLLVVFSRQWHVFNLFRFFTIGEYHLQPLRSADYFITLPETRAAEVIRDELRTALGTRLTVWLAYEPQIPAAELTRYRDILSEDYNWCATPVERPDLTIERYGLASIGCLDPTTRDAVLLNYPSGIQLHAVEHAVADELQVALSWSVAETVPVNTYSVSLKLWDTADNFVAQRDVSLPAAGSQWQLVTMTIEELPAGDYTLTLVVYDWATGERLVAQGAAAQSAELPVSSVKLS